MKSACLGNHNSSAQNTNAKMSCKLKTDPPIVVPNKKRSKFHLSNFTLNLATTTSTTSARIKTQAHSDPAAAKILTATEPHLTARPPPPHTPWRPDVPQTRRSQLTQPTTCPKHTCSAIPNRNAQQQPATAHPHINNSTVNNTTRPSPCRKPAFIPHAPLSS